MSIDVQHTRAPRILPRTLEDVLYSWCRRMIGAGILVVAAALWISLITWSAGDPALTTTTSNPAINILGTVGAAVSDFLLQMLGLSVVFFLTPVVYFGALIAQGAAIARWRTRAITFAAAATAIAAGISALPTLPSWSLGELGYGGIVGNLSFMLGAAALGHLGLPAANATAGFLFITIGMWAYVRAFGLNRSEFAELVRPAVQLSQRAGRKVGRAARPHDMAGLGLHQVRDLVREKAEAFATQVRSTGLTHAPDVQNDNPNNSVAATPTYAGENTAVEGDAPRWSPEQRLFEFANFSASDAPDQPELPFSSAVERIDADSEFDFNDDVPAFIKRARDESGQRSAPLRAWFGAHGKPVDAPIAPSEPETAAPAPAKCRQIPAYQAPTLDLLRKPATPDQSGQFDPAHLQQRATALEGVLEDFRVKGEIKDVRPGPVITLFELEPARGTKSSRVISLADDVARSVSAVSARISVVPGRNAIGIELPNATRESFGLRELIDTPFYRDTKAKLPIVLGKGIGGEPVLADLARMPHLLVAGTTGSGKSVGVNAMIMSLLYRLGPEQCRFLMIDPKMLELSVYNGIPHLLTPVVTDPTKAVAALGWAVGEMEERYKQMAELGVRNVDAFNARVRAASARGETLSRRVQTGFCPDTGEALIEEKPLDLSPLPYIVVIVDEFADLMAVAGKEIEGLIQRLAQMARAAGIHLIMATQRPSVDVVTGTIKANFPTRISYRVASRIDSRTILNEPGAEQLLGQGDMLYSNETGKIQRVHGPFVSDEEVEAVADRLRRLAAPNYVPGIADAVEHAMQETTPNAKETGDLYEQAVDIVVRDQKASTSYLQRRLTIGYNRAADLIERLEANGVIGPANHAGKRAILSGAAGEAA